MNGKDRDFLLAAVKAESERLAVVERELYAARAARDRVIRFARANGVTLREIGAAAGLHHTAVRKIERAAG